MYNRLEKNEQQALLGNLETDFYCIYLYKTWNTVSVNKSSVTCYIEID